MFDQYISNLAYNIEKPEKPYCIDIILEGGANNGVYELGVLLFIKYLETQGYLKVNRISGASIGSLMGFLYFTDLLTESIDVFQSLKDYFQNNLHLHCYEDKITQLVEMLNDDVFKTISKNKLYIATIDMESKQQVIISDFNTKKELIDAITKSCYIPYIIGETAYYKTKFIDGCFPHIFTSRRECDNKILYVSINRFKQMKFIFSIHKEKNVHGRIFHGILDAYMFFLYNKPTVMCSYVNNWSIIDYATLRGKQYVAIVLFSLLLVCFRIWDNISLNVKQVPFVNVLLILINNLYRDIVLYLCF